jgi:hypothetical protein
MRGDKGAAGGTLVAGGTVAPGDRELSRGGCAGLAGGCAARGDATAGGLGAITAGGRALGNGGREADPGTVGAATLPGPPKLPAGADGRAVKGGAGVITVVRAGPAAVPAVGVASGNCTTSVRVGTKRGGVRGGCCVAISRLSTPSHAV